MRRLYIVLAAALIAAMLVGLTSVASAAPSEPKPYVALAVAPSMVEYAVDEGATMGQAQRKALYGCERLGKAVPAYTGDCQGAVWAYNGWVAGAFESTLEQPYKNTAWGSGWGKTADKAIYEARRVCRNHAQENCYIRNDSDGPYQSPSYHPGLKAKGGAW